MSGNELVVDNFYAYRTFSSVADSEVASTILRSAGHQPTDLVLTLHGTQCPITGSEVAFPIGRNKGAETVIFSNVFGVRHLTMTELERLQGFPDGHTAIMFGGKPATRKVRAAAIGNSMAVPCMAFIGERLGAFMGQD